MATAFLEGWVTRLGVLRELHTDMGNNFESEMFVGMCKVLGIKLGPLLALKCQYKSPCWFSLSISKYQYPVQLYDTFIFKSI